MRCGITSFRRKARPVRCAIREDTLDDLQYTQSKTTCQVLCPYTSAFSACTQLQLTEAICDNPRHTVLLCPPISLRSPRDLPPAYTAQTPTPAPPTPLPTTTPTPPGNLLRLQQLLLELLLRIPQGYFLPDRLRGLLQSPQPLLRNSPSLLPKTPTHHPPQQTIQPIRLLEMRLPTHHHPQKHPPNLPSGHLIQRLSHLRHRQILPTQPNIYPLN